MTTFSLRAPIARAIAPVAWLGRRRPGWPLLARPAITERGAIARMISLRSLAGIVWLALLSIRASLRLPVLWIRSWLPWPIAPVSGLERRRSRRTVPERGARPIAERRATGGLVTLLSAALRPVPKSAALAVLPRPIAPVALLSCLAPRSLLSISPGPVTVAPRRTARLLWLITPVGPRRPCADAVLASGRLRRPRRPVA